MSPKDAYIIGGLLVALLLWYPYCRYTYVQEREVFLTFRFWKKSLLIFTGGFMAGLVLVAAL